MAFYIGDIVRVSANSVSKHNGKLGTIVTRKIQSKGSYIIEIDNKRTTILERNLILHKSFIELNDERLLTSRPKPNDQ